MLALLLSSCFSDAVNEGTFHLSGTTVGVIVGDSRLGEGFNVSSYDSVDFKIASPSDYNGTVLRIMLPTDQAEWSEQIRKKYGEELASKWNALRTRGTKASFLIEKEALLRYLETKKSGADIASVYGDTLTDLRIETK